MELIPNTLTDQHLVFLQLPPVLNSISVWSWYWGSISVWLYCREMNRKLTEIEILQDQISDRENARNRALSFTDTISPGKAGWLFCL